MKLKTISQMIGVSKSHLCNVLSGRSSFSDDKAFKMSVVTGTKQSIWKSTKQKNIASVLRKQAIAKIENAIND